MTETADDKSTADFIYSSQANDVTTCSQPQQNHDIKIIQPKLFNDNIKIDLLHKPFVGGYINKRTNRVYHHCGIQYPFKPRHRDKKNKLFCRQTQTVKLANHRQQTGHNCHTQMDRKDLLLDHSKDKEIKEEQRILDTKQYIDAKQVQLTKIDCAITIQCALRSHFAKQKLNDLKSEKKKQIQHNLIKLKKEQILLEKQQKLLDFKKNNPQSSHEFRKIINNMTYWNNKQLSNLLKNKHIPQQIKSARKSHLIHAHNKKLRNLQQRQLRTYL